MIITDLPQSVPSSGLTFLLAHPHRLLRGSIRPLLTELGPFVSAYESGTFGELVVTLNETRNIGLLLLAGCLPGMNGLASVRAIHDRFPNVKIMLLIDHADPSVIFEALRAGAQGVIFQTVSADAMLSALRLLLAGELYLPSETVTTLLKTDDRLEVSTAMSAHFSASESEVIPLLMDGLCNKIIAYRLGIEEAAVKARLRGIYRKMGVANRAQAVMRLLVRGQQDPVAEPVVAMAG